MPSPRCLYIFFLRCILAFRRASGDVLYVKAFSSMCRTSRHQLCFVIFFCVLPHCARSCFCFFERGIFLIVLRHVRPVAARRRRTVCAGTLIPHFFHISAAIIGASTCPVFRLSRSFQHVKILRSVALDVVGLRPAPFGLALFFFFFSSVAGLWVDPFSSLVTVDFAGFLAAFRTCSGLEVHIQSRCVAWNVFWSI